MRAQFNLFLAIGVLVITFSGCTSFPQPTSQPATLPAAPVATDVVLVSSLTPFPITPGTRWVYLKTGYTQAEGDPLKMIAGTSKIDEHVEGMQTFPPFILVHIQGNKTMLSADAGWQENGAFGLGDYEYWLVIKDDRVYLSYRPPNPAQIKPEEMRLLYQFPFQAGSEWCPGSEIAGTPAPELSICGNKTIITAERPYLSRLGKLEPCYEIHDIANSGSVISQFCDGIGLVAQKYDHGGSRFGFSEELIQFINGKDGSTLTASTSARSGAIQYTVAVGDNLISIAKKFSLKPETVLWANAGQVWDNPEKIKPGMLLRIPATDGLYYAWQSGDTIQAVAKRFGADPQAILDWPENPTQIATPGMTLFLPGGKQPFAPEIQEHPALYCVWEDIPPQDLQEQKDARTGNTQNTYTNTAYRFLFRFPSGWTLSKCSFPYPNFLVLKPVQRIGEDIMFIIGFRQETEDLGIMRTGVGSGEIIQQGSVKFLQADVSRDVLIDLGKIKSVLYQHAQEISRSPLLFTLSIDNEEFGENVELSPEIQAAADQIVQSFEFISPTPGRP